MLHRLVFAALLAAAAPLSTQQPPADDIIARHLQARGGAERLHALRTIIYRNGTYREGSYVGSGSAFMAMARPYFKIVGDPTDPQSTFREGYDGSAWEWYGSPGFVVRTTGAANAAIRHNLDPEGPFVDYRGKGSTVQRIDDALIAGKPAYGLLLTLRDGFRQEYYVDRVSFLIVATRKTAQVHAFGRPVTSEERFSDYRAVEGIQFPFRSTEVDIATGRDLNSMTWGEIIVNRELPLEWFSPPTVPHTALLDLLEQLYGERSDTSAVLWTYSAFRRGHAEVDTRAGIEAIGYQMLKTGDHAGAISLLAHNAADYPTSSTSAFGLGRAYAASGDTARARSELQRAIKLDPANQRAADALAALR